MWYMRPFSSCLPLNWRADCLGDVVGKRTSIFELLANENVPTLSTQIGPFLDVVHVSILELCAIENPPTSLKWRADCLDIVVGLSSSCLPTRMTNLIDTEWNLVFGKQIFCRKCSGLLVDVPN